MSEVEEWRAVEHDPRYWVSSLGRIRGAQGKVLSINATTKGYRVFRIRPKTLYVHRVVCIAFHGPPPTPQHEAAHWNGIPTDNRAANLRWATRSENCLDSVRHGTSHFLNASMRGEESPVSKLTWAQVRAIRRLYATGRYTQPELGRMFDISWQNVGAIVRNQRWIEEPA